MLPVDALWLDVSPSPQPKHDEHRYSLPDNNNHILNASHSNPGGAFIDSISFLPISHANGNGDDSDSDPEDLMLDLVMDHLTMSSSFVRACEWTQCVAGGLLF